MIIEREREIQMQLPINRIERSNLLNEKIGGLPTEEKKNE